MSYRKKCLFVNTNVAVSVSRQSTFPVCVAVCVGGSKAKSTMIQRDVGLNIHSSRKCLSRHSRAEQSRSYSKYIKSHGDLQLEALFSLYWQMHFISLFPFWQTMYHPLFPLLLCLATCGTQPLQYPAVHQTKSGMRNILRLPANSYENMLRPNLKQFAMANTHWLSDPARHELVPVASSYC